MKKIYEIVIDTETCPIDNTVEDVDPENMFVYDYGWSVVDRKGNVYLERSFVNADIFFGEKDLMKSAYYAKKIPMYIKDIEDGTKTLATYATIRRTFIEDMADFGVTFTDVADNSPKQERTLEACTTAICYAIENKHLLDAMLKTKKLPLAQLVKGSGVERKTLERHRKYILVMLLIQTNGYEIIRGHLRHALKTKGGTSV